MNTKIAPVLATAAFARNLFARTDCIGPDEIKQAFGLEINADIPPIPFTEDELTRARKLGQFLILYNRSITMQQLHDRAKNKLGVGKLLYDTDWYSKEPFFTEETPALGWKLVGREVIPGSTSQNYLGQTEVLATYVTDQVFAGMKLPAVYKVALAEFEDSKAAIGKIVDSDWKKAAEELSELKLNQLFRGTPAETLYGYIAYFEINHEYLLPDMYHWTASRSSDGDLVRLGGGESDGVGVYDDDPRFSDSNLGVVFSRSVAPDLVS